MNPVHSILDGVRSFRRPSGLLKENGLGRLHDAFKAQISDLPIRIWPDVAEVKDIKYLAFEHP